LRRSINYEPIGLRRTSACAKDLPVIAGTLNIGASGDAIVVVIRRQAGQLIWSAPAERSDDGALDVR